MSEAEAFLSLGRDRCNRVEASMTSPVISYLGRHCWGLVATFIALGGTAFAVSSGGGSSIHACVNRATGAVRIASHCHHNERAMTWASVGPRGPAGLAGPSDAYYEYSLPNANGSGASITVPPGDYVAFGGCTATQLQTASQSSSVPAFGEAEAFLTTQASFFSAGPSEGAATSASVPNMGETFIDGGGPASESGSASLSSSEGFQLPKGGTIHEFCRAAEGSHGSAHSDQPLSFSNTYVTAIKVASLHNQGAPHPSP